MAAVHAACFALRPVKILYGNKVWVHILIEPHELHAKKWRRLGEHRERSKRELAVAIVDEYAGFGSRR